jgi:hypothetical protein
MMLQVSVGAQCIASPRSSPMWQDREAKTITSGTCSWEDHVASPAASVGTDKAGGRGQLREGGDEGILSRLESADVLFAGQSCGVEVWRGRSMSSCAGTTVGERDTISSSQAKPELITGTMGVGGEGWLTAGGLVPRSTPKRARPSQPVGWHGDGPDRES